MALSRPSAGSAWGRAGRAAVLPRIGERIGDALRRRRMRGEKVGRAWIDGARRRRLELGIVLHRGEEAHRAIRVVTGARGDADADGVGLEFLGAREARQRQFRFGERQRAFLRVADHVGEDAASQVGEPRLLFADGGVAGDDVPHLVRQHGGEFGFVVGERDQAARGVQLTVRQRERVDRLRIEHRHFVMQVRPLGRRHQPLDRLLEHRLQLGIVIDAAIGRQDALVLAQRRRRHGGFRRLCRRRQSRLRRQSGRRGRAGREQQRRGGNGRMRQPPACNAPAHKRPACYPPVCHRQWRQSDHHLNPVRPLRRSAAAALFAALTCARKARSAPAAPPRSTDRRAPRSNREPVRACRQAASVRPRPPRIYARFASRS